jgi:hypothetical protein
VLFGNPVGCLAGNSKHWRSMCYPTIEISMDGLSQLSEPNKVNEQRNQQDSGRPEISNSKW